MQVQSYDKWRRGDENLENKPFNKWGLTLFFYFYFYLTFVFIHALILS